MISQPFVATHRHFKGKMYQVLGEGTDTDSMEPVVIYRDAENKVWVRPLYEFKDIFQDGTYRFSPIQ